MVDLEMEQADQEENILDLTGQGLKRIEPVSGVSPTTVIYNKNAISKIENLESYPELQQLSIAENRIIRMIGVAKLVNLTVLNLPNNNIVTIEGLKSLNKLVWLNLTGNSIKVLEQVQHNTALRHLDVSDNSIASISDLTPLKNLKTLLLHGNAVSSLKGVNMLLPTSLSILSLAENQLTDLNEVMNLSFLPNLEQLSIMNNPCVIMTSNMPGFDYRPFVVNWCLNLRILDGYIMTEKESLKAEWLYSQGKGRHFRPGQHLQLVHYLASVCPLTADRHEPEQDAKLAKILSQQRYHQKQLTGSGFHVHFDEDVAENEKKGKIKRPTPKINALKREETKSPNLYPVETPASLYAGSYDRTPVKAWSDRVDRSRSDSPNQIAPKVGMNAGDVQLQDISAEEENGTSNTSLLESDSVYIPVSDGEVTPPRAETAPPAVNKSLPLTSDIPPEQRPTTAMNDKNKQPEGRQLKISQEVKHRLAARFKQHITPELAQAYKSQSPTEGKLKTSEDKANQRKRSAHSTASESESDVSDGGSSKEGRILKRAARRNAEGKENVADSANFKNAAKLRVKMHSPSLSMYSPRVQPEKEHRPKFATQMTGENILMNGFKSDYFDENNPGHQLNKAAVTIQSYWRGYHARLKNQKIIEVRQEIRARRAEDHIRFLRAELERSAINYEQEKKLRNLQLEAIKFLWREVQTLQKWREETSGEVAPHSSNGKNGQVTLMEAGSENTPFPSVLESESTIKCPDQRHTQLVSMCAKLQSQVSQLQETLSTVTNYVFQGSVSAGTDRDEDPIRVLADISETPVKTKSRGQNVWEVVSNILPEASVTPTPLPGTPTPPSDVLVAHKGDSSVVVQWVSSRVLTADGKDSHGPVIGYRVYVNDLPKGMVAGIKPRAFIDGLDPKAQHKVYLRAVSALGESSNSNIVTVQKVSNDTPTKGPRGNNDQKPPTSRSRQSSGGSTKGENSSEGKGQGSDGEYRTRKASSSSRRSSDAGSTKDDDISESSPKSMSTHTPKIIPPYRKLREVTTDSDDGGAKDVTPDSSPSPVVKTHRRNRSIEKSNHQPLPDKLQEADLKGKVGQEPHSPGSDKENINTETGSPPGTVDGRNEILQRPTRVERQRSTSLSEDTPTRDSPTGLAKSNSSESVAKQFLRSCSPSPSDSLPHRATHKEQQSLNKLQRSITDMSELTSETTDSTDIHSRISVGRSGSLKSKTKPDKYRLSPTRELLERHRRPGSGSSSPVVQIGADQDKENAEHPMLGGSLRHSMDTAETREHRPVTVRRSSSMKARFLLQNDPSDESLSGVNRSASVRSRLLPDKCDLSNTTGSDGGDRSGPSSPTATQKVPENVLDSGDNVQSQQRKVIIREKKNSSDESNTSPKSKIKSGLISKLKSHFPPK
ncbi:uncharacterized protein LOC135487712 isoform X3 [Lineus longissimus]|uniref:uncharacterized protein LOC135487712 isoform X3 n=1 Tax=Lineus longissimus TaxID=88925 RepID=UPI002B4CC7A8